MSEKIYTVSADNGKTYKLTVNSSSSSLTLKLQNQSNPSETYQTSGLNLAALQKLNKIYKQFDNVPKIADVIGKKIDNKNFVLKTNQCVLKFKHTNEYDDEEYITYELPQTGGGSSVGGGSGELDRLRRENEDLKRQIQELKGKPASTPSYSAPTSSYKAPTSSYSGSQPSSFPSKPLRQLGSEDKFEPSKQRPAQPKTVTLDTSETVCSISHPTMNFVSTQKFERTKGVFNEQQPIYSLDTSINYKSQGDFFTRVNICKDRINNVKGVLDSIETRLSPLESSYNKDIGRIFASDPSNADKQKALDIMWKILRLYLEFKEITKYDQMFKWELREKGQTLSPADQKKFDEACVVFNKRLPFDQGQRINKLNNSMRMMIKNFFIEKNMRFYKKDEIANIDNFQHVLMWNSA